MSDAADLHVVPPRLPNCFRCGAYMKLSKWQAGSIQCPACVKAVGRGTVRDEHCTVCRVRLDPQRQRRNRLCPPHLEAYKRRTWQHATERRRARKTRAREA